MFWEGCGEGCGDGDEGMREEEGEGLGGRWRDEGREGRKGERKERRKDKLI